MNDIITIDITNKTRMMERYQALVYLNILARIETDITYAEYEHDMKFLDLLEGGDIGYKLKKKNLGYTHTNVRRGKGWKPLQQTEAERFNDECLTIALVQDIIVLLERTGELQ